MKGAIVFFALGSEMIALYAVSLAVNGIREAIVTEIAMVLTLAVLTVHAFERGDA